MTQLPSILAAQSEFYDRAITTKAYLAYVRQHGIDVRRITDFAGATGLMEIVDCGNGRFDWTGLGISTTGFVCEAIDADGETVIDLVAWPIERPTQVMTMFGRAALLGLWEAVNPATFCLGKSLTMHRTTLEWLVAGCQGAAVVHSGRAAWAFLDIPGPIAARDRIHAAKLLDIARTVVDETQIVVATQRLARAA
ncbi:MAG: hypothetical protein JWR75_1753 [Devosia sp.]|nr:hypothetical protein [Devosia sp.]